ncbi:MAG: phosphate transporter substrate-binding protein [Pseudoduganella sp.]|jgi:phosphate transport system substrate-binding protein|nr:phosphate transporter substrate-binding protein [Pseudoduganella sp.]
MGIVLAVLGLNRAAAGADPASPRLHQTRLQIAGSSTMAPLLTEIAAKYRLLHPDVFIDVDLGGSQRGLDAVRTGRAQIAMLSRALAPGEHDLYGIPIARDGIGFVVHASNPLRQLSPAQLRAVFSGQARNWHGLGGSDVSILSVGALPGSVSNALVARFLKLAPDEFELYAAVESNTERLAVVASCENAIGLVSVGAAESAIAQGLSVRLLPVSGVAPSMASIRNGSYPICRSLTLASKDPPVGVARSFFAFCLSAQVNSILARFDFVPYLD